MNSPIFCIDIDSDPRKVGVKEMIQGIVSLGENGPSDGGLVVMSRSHKLHQQFYDEHGGIDPKKDAGVGNNGRLVPAQIPERTPG